MLLCFNVSRETADRSPSADFPGTFRYKDKLVCQGHFARSREASVSGMFLQVCLWAVTQFPADMLINNAVDSPQPNTPLYCLYSL